MNGSNSIEDSKHFDASRFTTEEKLALCGGADLWHLRAIPAVSPSVKKGETSIRLSDGPHGLRKPLNDLTLQESHPATCFPSTCATACSWNVDLIKCMGRALAKECEYNDVQVLLGPGVNLKRSPLGDPLLTGLLARAYIAGVQHSGSVAACIKHFCANNQESTRMVVDAIIDERTLRELYLPAFEMSICPPDGGNSNRDSPKLVMAAYNKVNGVYCCEHKYLLQSILRDEWKFSGIVVSDWGAVNDRIESLRVGMDLEMPGTFKKGVFDQEVLECVKSENSDSQQLFEEHDQLARKIARECIVLLQNKDNLLPLSRMKNIALIGDFAKDSPRYQAMGSAHVTPTKITSVYAAMKSFLFKNRENDIETQQIKIEENETIPFARGYDIDDEGGEIEQHLIDEAVEIAQQPGVDVVVLCVGLPEIMESEGFDRMHMHLPRQHIALVEAVARVHQNVVVVLSNGGIVEVPQSFVGGAKSILEGFLLGQNGGEALVDVLFGVSSPSGKLPETIPTRGGEVPSSKYFPGTKERVEYREGLDVGYRYFDTAKIPVRFPFGHGLQYSNFHYSNLVVDIDQDEENYKLVVVSMDVENIGRANKDGSPLFSKPVMEVIQLYIRPIHSSVYRPYHELKSFSKIELALGEKKSVYFALNERCFSYYDIGLRDWIVEESTLFEIQVGASSRDIRLTELIGFETGRKPSQIAKESYLPVVAEGEASVDSVHAVPKRFHVDEEQFGKRFVVDGATAHEFPVSVGNCGDPAVQHPNGKQPICRNTLLSDAASVSWIAYTLQLISLTVASTKVKKGPTKKRECRMIRANVENLPLRGLVIFSKGHFSFRQLDFLILVMNGFWAAALANITSYICGLVFSNKQKQKSK
eukprot:jgi/Psemu1/69449/estExt_Genemark1.C_8610004